MKNLILLLFILNLFSPIKVLSAKQQIAYSQGKAINSKNQFVESEDLIYSHSVTHFFHKRLEIGLLARVGYLPVDSEKATKAGIGGYIQFPLFKNLNNLNFSIPISMLWLDKSRFAASGDFIRNYGGNIQFTYAGEISYNITEYFVFFYRLEHMSNANMYHYNPGLDTHNFGLKVTF